MKRILVICPTQRDRYELQHKNFLQNYEIHFQTYDEYALKRVLYQGEQWLTHNFDPQLVVDQLCAYVRNHQIDAVFSSEDYPGSLLASVVAHETSLIGPIINKLLLFHHKYHARECQQILVPEATPLFDYLHKNNKKQTFLTKPFFVKPVKSFLSIGAQSIDNEACLSVLEKSFLPDAFLQQFDWFIKKYSSFLPSTGMVIVEQLLHGVQVTLEGFVSNRNVIILGITDSIMHADCKMSFDRFVYPSQLPESVCDRMYNITQRLISNSGFDNSFFNIEFMYDQEKDDIKIIEVHSRMASQFTDLYEKVDGKNSYFYACEVALGITPHVQCRKGVFSVAASFVLRSLTNKKVIKIPTQNEINYAKNIFPDLRFYCFVTPGKTLADTIQDGFSYRYALIHLGGNSLTHLEERFVACKKLLPFVFEDIA